MRPACGSCCFFRLVEAKGKPRGLCQFTGEKKPDCGMRGCHYIKGQWADIDAILGLQKTEDCGNSGDPNTMKLATAFPINGINVADIHCLDDFSANADSHISEKLEGSLVRPGIREDQVAHSARERTRLPFSRLNPIL